MEYIHKLPFLLGGFMAIIVGMAGYLEGIATKVVYIRMAIALVAFYLVGYLIRSTVVGIMEEVKKKEEQKALEAAEEARRAEEAKEAEKEKQSKHKINLVAGDDNDDGDGFTPLNVSRIISSKLKE